MKLRFGIQAKLAIFVGLLLLIISAGIVAIVRKDQEVALAESFQRELEPYVLPIESLVLEIDDFALRLASLEGARLVLQKTNNKKLFDEKGIDSAQESLLASLSQRIDVGEKKRDLNVLRQYARGYAIALNSGDLVAKQRARTALDEVVRNYFQYAEKQKSAFRSIDSTKIRIQSISQERWARFDSGTIESENYTLRRKGKISPINTLDWTNPEIKKGLDILYVAYEKGQPSSSPSTIHFSSDERIYQIISRPIFRKNDAVERGLDLRKLRNSEFESLWNKFFVEESALGQRFTFAGKDLINTFVKASLLWDKISEDDGRPLRGEELKATLEEYKQARGEYESAVKSYKGLLDERETILKKYEALYLSQSRAVDEDANSHSKEKQDISALRYIRDSQLMQQSYIRLDFNPLDYYTFSQDKTYRDATIRRWELMRDWILNPNPTIEKAPYFSNLLQRIEKKKAMELMIRLDSMSIPSVVDAGLTDNMAGFTRIAVDVSDYALRQKKDLSGLIDKTLSIALRGLFLSFLLSGLVVKAIQKIIEGADQVGKGNLKVKFEYAGRDELGSLVDSLNGMVVGLKERAEMRSELATAEQIQKMLLPDKLPSDMQGSLTYGVFYKAMSGVGGDYFDFIEVSSNEVCVCIADVSNHGVGPAIIMTQLRSYLHAVLKASSPDPREILLRLNERLTAETPANIFVTLFLGIYNRDTHEIRYANAGHNLPIVFRYQTATVEEIGGGGLPLGAVENDIFGSMLETKRTQLKAGDLFFQYTDGVNEAMNDANDMFGTDRLNAILVAYGKKKPQGIVDYIAKEVEVFSGKKIFCEGPSQLNDDIAMICFRRIK